MNNLFFSLHQSELDNKYIILRLEIFESEIAGRYRQYTENPHLLTLDPGQHTLALKWQGEYVTGQATDKDYWYGLEVLPRLNTHGGAENLLNLSARTHALVQRVFKNLTYNHYEIQPADIVAKLRRLRAHYVAYDARSHDMRQPQDFPPLDHYRWMDNTALYEALDEYSGRRTANIQTSVICPQAEAEQRLDEHWRTINGEVLNAYQWAEKVSEHRAKRYFNWVYANRPLRTADYETPVTPAPVETLLALPTRKSRW